jgi:hypothetical protein
MSEIEHPQRGFLILLKFGERQHLSEFREKGLLYLNPLSYFSSLESDSARADPFEGTTTIIQPQHIAEFKFSSCIGECTASPSDFVGPIRMSLNRIASCNLYCMFAVTKPIEGELVDKRNFEFGDSFVLVLNTQEFMSRVSLAAQKAGLSGRYGLVEYYDRGERSGEIGPFHKPSTFAYQNEFRIVLRPGSGEPIQLMVGSLLDITSDVSPLREINQIVDFSTKSAREAGLSW